MVRSKRTSETFPVANTVAFMMVSAGTDRGIHIVHIGLMGEGFNCCSAVVYQQRRV